MSNFESFDLKITNMSTMLTRLGIQPAQFAQERFTSLFTASMGACLECPGGAVCRDWLVRASERLDRAPAFCPNGERFEQAKRMLAGEGNARRRQPGRKSGYGPRETAPLV